MTAALKWLSVSGLSSSLVVLSGWWHSRHSLSSMVIGSMSSTVCGITGGAPGKARSMFSDSPAWVSMYTGRGCSVSAPRSASRK
jgi:hypothetical protein